MPREPRRSLTGGRPRPPRLESWPWPRPRLRAARLVTVAAAAFALLLGSASAAQPATRPLQKVDNPYAGGAQVYVNPDWSARAASEPGGAAVADQPTAVWLYDIASIVREGAGNGMGLREHLDTALAQGADVVQLVLYNAPGRNCAWTRSYGQLAPDEIDLYRYEYVDPIVEIISQPEYAELRVVTVIEPFSLLPYLLTHVSPHEDANELCDEMLANGGYAEAIGYAVAALGATPNAYPYLDISHHGWFAGPDGDPSVSAAVDLLLEAVSAGGGSLADVHGLASNVANYGLLRGDVGGIDGELTYALDVRDAAVAAGLPDDAGVLIDTSRNGWGGGPDLRDDPTYWCNQPNAGLGERPTAEPEPGVDAYVWIKPPGESDGSSEIVIDEGHGGLFAECLPEVTGALPDSPVTGHWFSVHFQQLLANAYPPL